MKMCIRDRAGIALDGKSFFYVNPLEVWPDNCLPRTSKEHVKPERQKWFGVACCPPNIARTQMCIRDRLSFEEFQVSQGAAAANILFLILPVVGCFYIKTISDDEVM